MDAQTSNQAATDPGEAKPARSPPTFTGSLSRRMLLIASAWILVLLVGGTAHRFAYGPAARLDDLVGRTLAWDAAPGASVLALPHPSGASTWLNDPARVELWRRGIGLLRDRWAELEA